MYDKLTFLEETEYTEVTPEILEVVSKFDSNKPWRDAARFISSLNFNPTGEKRLRNATQILSSGYCSGFADRALLFRTFMIAKGIPCRVVEAVEEAWINESFEGNVMGHVFVEFFADGKWVLVDPLRGPVGEDLFFQGKKYVEVGRGLDFLQIYLKKGLYKDWANIQSHDLLRQVAEKGKICMT